MAEAQGAEKVSGERRVPTVTHWLEYAAARGAIALIRMLPLSWAQRLGELLGQLVYWPLGIRRWVVLRQLAAAFPERSPREVAFLARRSYAHLGRVLAESARIAWCGRGEVQRLVESESGVDAILAAASQGRGVVLITGHIGNWELAGAYMALRGVPMEVIVRRLNNPLVDRMAREARERAGMIVVPDAEAVRRVPRAFREGHAMAFVADQGVLGLASTFVPFFGRPAKTPRGPAVFALRFAVPAFFVTMLRKPNGRYHCEAVPVPYDPSADREVESDRFVAAFTAILESWVRRYPEQYFWQHRRWRRQPPNTPEALRDPTAIREERV
jgi:KDO2-lipid IV(A) lauroyltransferase